MKRRAMLLSTLALCTAGLGPVVAQAADNYPSRPVRMIVGYAPGGPADILARMVAQDMSAKLGQAIVVENRPGAASAIAAGAVAKAQPDGYTLLWGPSTPMVMNAVLRDDLGYDPVKDFTQLGTIADMVLVLVASLDSGLNSLDDLITRSKANPKQYFYGSSGTGTAMNFAAEKLKHETGIQMDHVPFSGSVPNLAALVSGQIQVASDLTVAVMPLIEGGRIKPLAVMSEQRLPELPNIPAVAERVPGFKFTTFQAVQAPAGLPEPIRVKLEAALKDVVTTPEFEQKLRNINYIPAYADGAGAQARIAREIAEYRQLATQANIKVD